MAGGFQAGQEAILYFEIDNFTAREISETESRRQVLMYEVELLARYDILDQDQRIVLSRTMKGVRDRSRQYRRDFFVAQLFHVPRIGRGYYTLELTVEDKKGGKFGGGTINFRIR